MKAKLAAFKMCPICGSAPEITVNDLGRENGRGYPGHHSTSAECPHCGLMPRVSVDDIYRETAAVMPKLVESWNRHVDEVENFIQHRND